MDSDAECPVCGLTFLEDDSGKPWVCCDGCQSWFDFKCTAIANPEPVPRKFFLSQLHVETVTAVCKLYSSV